MSDFKIRTKDRQFLAFTKEDNNQWSEPFFFIHSADNQFGLYDKYEHNPSFISDMDYPNPNSDYEIRTNGAAIRAVNKMRPKPKFFVACGDLVEDKPGMNAVQTRRRKDQINDHKKTLSELDEDIPLVCICGDHDVGEHPTPSTIAEYRKEYGDDYFSFICSGVLFVCPNSSYWCDRSRVQELAEEHDKWFDKVLEEFRNNSALKHVIVFQHIPWFKADVDEETDWLDTADDRFQLNIEKQLRLKMLDKLYESGVRKIFADHYHRNCGGMYKDMEVVITSALGKPFGADGSGVRVVKVLDNSIEHQYYRCKEVSERD